MRHALLIIAFALLDAGCCAMDGVDCTVPGFPPSGPEPEEGNLVAGEWRDLDHWDFWSSLAERDEPAHCWRFQHFGKFSVDVDHDGMPTADARVELRDEEGTVLWRARTDVHGRADFVAWTSGVHPVSPFAIVVGGEEGVREQEIPLDDDTVTPIAVELVLEPPPPIVDLMFVIDTTIAMEDSLTYLQSRLPDVIERVRDGTNEIRLSLVFYRHDGDAWTVGSLPFTTDVEAVFAVLAQQHAGGGRGDEAMARALDDAIVGHDWSPRARARVLFWLLGETPAIHDPNRIAFRGHAYAAAAAGIRIIPIAGVRLDESGQFLARFIDIATAGTYVFLVEQLGSGDGFDPTPPTVGDVFVEDLDDLLVRLISHSIGDAG